MVTWPHVVTVVTEGPTGGYVFLVVELVEDMRDSCLDMVCTSMSNLRGADWMKKTSAYNV